MKVFLFSKIYICWGNCISYRPEGHFIIMHFSMISPYHNFFHLPLLLSFPPLMLSSPGHMLFLPIPPQYPLLYVATVANMLLHIEILSFLAQYCTLYIPALLHIHLIDNPASMSPQKEYCCFLPYPGYQGLLSYHYKINEFWVFLNFWWFFSKVTA